VCLIDVCQQGLLTEGGPINRPPAVQPMCLCRCLRNYFHQILRICDWLTAAGNRLVIVKHERWPSILWACLDDVPWWSGPVRCFCLQTLHLWPMLTLRSAKSSSRTKILTRLGRDLLQN